MAPFHPTAKAEREKKVNFVCSFASGLTDRLDASSDKEFADDLQAQIRGLPLAASSAVAAKQDELEKLGTDLWNTSTRLRRGLPHTNGDLSEETLRKDHEIGLLRVFSFLLLASAGSQSVKGQERKNCIRLMKIALKAARWCIENKEVGNATKVLEHAAEYQEILAQEGEKRTGETELGERLRVEYYALRTALAWRSNRLDTAEHMFTKCKTLSRFLTASLAEGIADLFYEMGKDLLSKHDYEASIRWLERAHDVVGEQSLERLSAEAGELKDQEGKMSISLLRLEILYSEAKVDPEQVYLGEWYNIEQKTVQVIDATAIRRACLQTLLIASVLHRVIRSVVLNERNVKTYVEPLVRQTIGLTTFQDFAPCSQAEGPQVIDELISTRLFREEKVAWVEKAVITRIWITCTTHVVEGTINQLRGLFDEVLRNIQAPFSAQVTHAAQTLLWKQIEATSSQGQHEEAEAWCGICLHALFDMAGEINKSKIARSLARKWCMEIPVLTSNRKMIMCTMARHDYAAAREIFLKMSDPGREDRITRYMMYKVALHGNYPDLAAECLDTVCRHSSKDTSLLYACVIEAQQSGNKREGIAALEKLLEKYNDQVPAGVHLPALLRMTVRLLMSEQIKNGVFQKGIFKQICRTFEGGASSVLNHRAELIVRSVSPCEGFATKTQYPQQGTIQNYVQVSKHGREFRLVSTAFVDKLRGSSKTDIIAKHSQVIKLELEAALKREQWEEMDDLFEECWRYGESQHYDTLADLVLIMYSSMSKDKVDGKYQTSGFIMVSANLNNDTPSHMPETPPPTSPYASMAFDVARTDQDVKELNHYPATELEWLATTAFNHAVDYYVQEKDEKCKLWAEKALTLADWGEDDNKLRDALMNKYKGLTWDDEN
ncbi:sporulation-specific protein 22 [Paraconiothyrium brasiliense]|uniref:Protein ZIP4 homolog n=1 Tax=Paraconiothyrium brasiliense TaxID=300254 RepID=A0ABR3RR39_9PLEO